MTAAGTFLAASSLWALLALSFQAARAFRRFRLPYASQVGDLRRAVLYNFTIAMLPSHKESVALHPFSFAAGAFLHLAVFTSLTAALSSLVSPAWPELAGPFFGWTAVVGTVACGFLLLRRYWDPELRTISVPDDFVAAFAVGIFLTASAAAAFHRLPTATLHLATGFLLIYMPVGKLRHAVFFFLARADLGRKLGWRGVYPPARRTGTDA